MFVDMDVSFVLCLESGLGCMFHTASVRKLLVDLMGQKCFGRHI